MFQQWKWVPQGTECTSTSNDGWVYWDIPYAIQFNNHQLAAFTAVSGVPGRDYWIELWGWLGKARMTSYGVNNRVCPPLAIVSIGY